MATKKATKKSVTSKTKRTAASKSKASAGKDSAKGKAIEKTLQRGTLKNSAHPKKVATVAKSNAEGNASSSDPHMYGGSQANPEGPRKAGE